MRERVEKKHGALESTLCNVSLGSHPVRGELRSYDLQKKQNYTKLMTHHHSSDFLHSPYGWEWEFPKTLPRDTKH